VCTYFYISAALSDIVSETQFRFANKEHLPRENQLLLSFRGNNHKGIRNGVIQRVMIQQTNKPFLLGLQDKHFAKF
jgi:hypothetical protein